MKSSESGHINIVKYLVKNGADINQCDRYHQCPLFKASEGGYYDVVEYLVHHEADVNQCNEDNKSPLYKASEGGHYDVVKYLVRNNAKVNQCDHKNKTPLYKAVNIGHCNMVKFLLKNNADLTVRTNDDISPLQLAVWLNNSEIANELIKAENANIPFSGNYHLFNILIDIRKSVVCVDDESGNTDFDKKRKQHLSKGLFDFICLVSTDCLKHLLKLGLNVNRSYIEGQSLLNKIMESFMTTEKDKKIVLLVQNGADITVRDNHGMSFLEKIKEVLWYDEYHHVILITKQFIRRNSV